MPSQECPISGQYCFHSTCQDDLDMMVNVECAREENGDEDSVDSDGEMHWNGI